MKSHHVSEVHFLMVEGLAENIPPQGMYGHLLLLTSVVAIPAKSVLKDAMAAYPSGCPPPSGLGPMCIRPMGHILPFSYAPVQKGDPRIRGKTYE